MIATRLWCGLALSAALIATGSTTAAVAQVSFPTNAPAATVSGLVVSGSYVTAPIVLDGATLFRIGARLNAPVTQQPIGTRVGSIGLALGQLLIENGTGPRATTVFDPATLRVHVRREGGVNVLEAVDAKHTDPLAILTVTSSDAQANGTDEDALAVEWQSTLQSALVHSLQLRQPATEERSIKRLTNAAILLVVLSAIVLVLLRVIWKRIERLGLEVADRTRAAAAENTLTPEQPAADAKRRRFFAFALRALEPDRRLQLYGAVAETLTWGLLLAWLIAVTWGLSLFAETTPLAQTIAHSAVGVATIIITTGFLNRILDIVIARASAAWRLRRFKSSEDRARLLLRIPTIAQAVAGAKTFVLVFVAVLSVFGQVGVPIGSVVTIGGLAAIALSLAAQNFVRDFLNGFLVLLEDQYVVGDYVTINTFSGSVELLSLRMVQIRNAAGDLITIPHSSVVNVVNQSRNWSRVDYRVPVDPASDVTQALEIVRHEIETLLASGDWSRGVTQPLEWIGLDALSKDGVIIRASIRTAPLRQFELRREINAQVRAAFSKAGITLGAPLPPI